ncbi:REP-associated tyrosine transposase [Shimia sediminis]|uniref:REP-associated tyrosine transposase n=1 Tax=Shimia sediminis TaxID=2497945 RepID=UPI000F8EAB42|nr:transposase [Shimia sediminis]
MPRYIRDRTPGGTWFFTVCLRDRSSDLLVREIALLRRAVMGARINLPFRPDAWVVLPDHMHCIWTLPPGDADFSARWKSIKGRFSRALPDCASFRAAARRPGEKGVWQNRFWEHRIRDAHDLRQHLDILHLSPVNQGLVARPEAWPYSSIHRIRQQKGGLPPDWVPPPRVGRTACPTYPGVHHIR